MSLSRMLNPTALMFSSGTVKVVVVMPLTRSTLFTSRFVDTPADWNNKPGALAAQTHGWTGAPIAAAAAANVPPSSAAGPPSRADVSAGAVVSGDVLSGAVVSGGVSPGAVVSGVVVSGGTVVV